MTVHSPQNPEMIAFIRSELHLSENAVLEPDSSLEGAYPLRFDLKIIDRGKIYIVEFLRVIQLETLSHLGFLKYLLLSNNHATDDMEFILIGKHVSIEAEEAAVRTGLRIIRTPVGISAKKGPEKDTTPCMKLATVKSCVVIGYLLNMGETSIRKLSQESGVSYHWTHATVKALIEKGVVSVSNGYVKILDIDRFLTKIMLEMPIERFFQKESD